MLQRIVGSVAAVSLGFAASRSAGQCGEWDQRFGPALDMNSSVSALTEWDPDGPGPQSMQLVAVGRFTDARGVAANRIARWDHTAQVWQPFGVGLGDSTFQQASCVTIWDPDGTGPAAADVVVGGDFVTAGGVTVNYIARWDGSAWSSLGGGMSGKVWALTTWDPDGTGPLGAQLVAGGEFDSAGGVTVNRVARWDGMAWNALGAGIGGGTSPAVRSLATWDPDGNGPMAAQLAVGGSFSNAGGGQPNKCIALWNGTEWRQLGGGMSGGTAPTVSALRSWDPDGIGPQIPVLVAAGLFQTSGGTLTNNIASWNGSSWQALESGVNANVSVLAVWDPDEGGPASAHLLAGGNFNTAGGVTARGIARWDGGTWNAFGAGNNAASISSIGTLDPDGAGPLATQLFAGGVLTTPDGTNLFLARWSSSDWEPLGAGTKGSLLAMTMWDPDGAGPQDARIVVGGTFLRIGDTAAANIAMWDGALWQPLGSGLNGFVTALTTWDPDASGPQSPVVIAGGTFTIAGGAAASRVARWDGTSWQAMGAGLNDRVSTLISWDLDGAGPLSEILVAGGEFLLSGTEAVGHIAQWNGASWEALGDFVSATVRALTTWDPDGPGPQSTRLVVGGDFTSVGVVPANHIAQYDGSMWQPLGDGLGGTVFALTTWDPDGIGAQQPLVVAGGSFSVAGAVIAEHVARWNGSVWSPFAGGTNEWVYALTTWDPDASGPQLPHVAAGGLFTVAGSVVANGIAHWGGSSWQAFGSGMGTSDPEVYSVIPWDIDGSGPQSAQLLAAGRFTSAGGAAAGSVAAWLTLVPELIDQPVGDTVAQGALVNLSVTAAVGSLSYAWHKDGSPLADGATGHGSTLNGAMTAVLTISNAQPADSGDYTCRVSNECRSLFSDAATLTVAPPLCPGDANGDSAVNSADLSVLLAQFGTSVGVGAGADFNSDGMVNAADLSVLLANFGSGC